VQQRAQSQSLFELCRAPELVDEVNKCSSERRDLKVCRKEIGKLATRFACEELPEIIQKLYVLRLSKKIISGQNYSNYSNYSNFFPNKKEKLPRTFVNRNGNVVPLRCI
jgi:hypothetical protein